MMTDSTLPKGVNSLSVCKYCGETIGWYKNANGNWVPLDPPDYIEPHFASCKTRRKRKGAKNMSDEPRLTVSKNWDQADWDRFVQTDELPWEEDSCSSMMN